jgi:hypothetical protein
MFKKLLFCVFCVLSFDFFGQCAMCKAAVEKSDGGSGFNGAIIYLMLFPYIIGFSALVLIYFIRKKQKETRSN